MSGPVYFNQDIINLCKAAGINYKLLLGRKAPAEAQNVTLEAEIKQVLRVKDEQDAVNRYVWTNLPCDLSSQELERIIYYKGHICFFYLKTLDKFFFMPYTLDGTVDFYGRYNTINPLPMTSGTEEEKKTAQVALLSNLKLNVVKGIIEPTPEDLENSAVLLWDYTKQLSQTVTPRQQLNECIIALEAECLPFMRTNLINGTGVHGMRVPDGDSASNAKDVSNNMVRAAKTGQIFVPILGEAGDFQDFPAHTSSQANEYMMAMQSIDNLRLSTYGIKNGGLFEKTAHRNDSENMINQSSVESPLQDGLNIRQNFCNIVNSIWGLGIWCEISENNTTDTNLDGVVYDTTNASTGVETGESEVATDE